MQPETLPEVPREALARAAFEAAGKLDVCPPRAHGRSWSEIGMIEKGHWDDIAQAVLATAGLHVLAADVLAETQAVGTGIVEVSGDKHLRDPKGRLIPLGMIKAQHLLEDEMVRKVMRFATDLADQIARFKGHTFEDLNGFQSLLEQQYGARAGGAKGNVTFRSYDDTLRIEIRIADLLEFGAELQTAKKILDEVLKEWGAESRPELRALVNRVFSVEKEGQINRGELFSLLAMEIEDERWQRAMEAIRDSIRIIGSKEYLRFRHRPDPTANWSTVAIDLAAA
jgi:hypothetical protein